jgi:hypothetical protein
MRRWLVIAGLGLCAVVVALLVSVLAPRDDPPGQPTPVLVTETTLPPAP